MRTDTLMLCVRIVIYSGISAAFPLSAVVGGMATMIKAHIPRPSIRTPYVVHSSGVGGNI